jgi:8-oxo-dGTP pyrophosphatase MutT (NUDIX family)
MTHVYAVRASHERFTGPVFSVVTDEVAMPDGGHAERDYVRHIGAVGVVALDEQDRVVLIRQYRHPVRAFLWELPAGLLDVPGEDPVRTAARELAEEAGLRAALWYPLADVHTSPGYSTERIRIYLARELRPAPPTDFRPSHEEIELSVAQVELAKAAEMAYRGEITNAACVIGVLGAAYSRSLAWTNLPPAIVVGE